MEILDLYDNKKNKMGKTLIRESGEPLDGEFKLSIHLWIINSNGEFLIQKRSASRKAKPNKWAFTGGAVDSGEESYQGAIREAKEEMGINLDSNDVEFLLGFKREHDFVDVFIAKSDTDIKDVKMQESEVSESKWVNPSELDEIIRNGEFVPAINLYYDLFKKLLEKCKGIKF